MLVLKFPLAIETIASVTIVTPTKLITILVAIMKVIISHTTQFRAA